MTGRHSASGGRTEDETSKTGVLTWRSRRVWLPAIVALALVAATVGIVAAQTTQQGCSDRETVTVVAAPSIASVLDDAAPQGKSTHGVCTDVQVSPRKSADMVAELSRSDTEPPDVWVPDSSEWVQKLRRDTVGKVTRAQSLWISPPIASSPLVLAASAKDARSLVDTASGGWSKLLSGGSPLAVADPTTSTEGLLTLAAAQASLGRPSGTPTRRLVSGLVALSTDVVGGDTPALQASPEHPVPVSEQAVIAANAGSGSGDIQAVYPRDVGRSFDFPVVEFAPPERSPEHGDAVGAYVRSLYSAATQHALREIGLRDSDGSAFSSTVDFEGVAPTAVIPPSAQLSDRQMTGATRVWSAAERRNRTLVVVDVSGSMIGPKIRLATAAVRAAVGYLPDDARIGLWAFSTDLHGSSPWRSLVPLATLGSPSDGRRRTLRQAAGELPRLAAKRGKTGLYQTTAAAYRAVRGGYDPHRYNSVVLLTDGSNTVKGLSRNDLLTRLRSARSASRQLPILTVAIGPTADRGTLEKIAAATGGAEYDADSVGDILEVFLQAVIK